jgi:hypothetical protein
MFSEEEKGRVDSVRCDVTPRREGQWKTYSCEQPSSLIISSLQIRQQQQQQFKFHWDLFTASC